MTNAPTPWFVYGSLKPKQLGFRRIERWVSHSKQVDLSGHELVLRDGLPGIRASEQARSVRGALIWPKQGSGEELKRAIELFESAGDYETKDVSVNDDGVELIAHTNMLHKPNRSNPEVIRNGWWVVSQDLSFRYALPVLWRSAHEPGSDVYDSSTREYWEAYLPVMGTFLNLWSVFERYIAFAQPALDDPEYRKALDDPEYRKALDDPEKVRNSFTLAKHFNALNKSKVGQDVRSQIESSLPSEGRARRDSVSRSSRSATNPWDNWYAIRNNAVHGGKTAIKDLDIVSDAARGLSEALIELLAYEVPPLRKPYIEEGCLKR